MSRRPHFLPLAADSPEIFERQTRALALRAQGLTVREVAVQLQCSPYVAQTVLGRSKANPPSTGEAEWLQGLSHRAARALLDLGYISKDHVAQALSAGELSTALPGVGLKTLVALRSWMTDCSARSEPPKATAGEATDSD